MNDVMGCDRGKFGVVGDMCLGFGGLPPISPQTPLAASLKLLTKFSGKHTAKNEHKSKLWKQCITGSV